MSIFGFNKKPANNEDSYDEGFYRDPEDEAEVIDEEEDEELIPLAPTAPKVPTPAVTNWNEIGRVVLNQCLRYFPHITIGLQNLSVYWLTMLSSSV